MLIKHLVCSKYCNKLFTGIFCFSEVKQCFYFPQFVGVGVVRFSYFNLLKVNVYVLAEPGLESGPVCSRTYLNHYPVLTWLWPKLTGLLGNMEDNQFL